MKQELTDRASFVRIGALAAAIFAVLSDQIKDSKITGQSE
jgi:hypothetical protein